MTRKEKLIFIYEKRQKMQCQSKVKLGQGKVEQLEGLKKIYGNKIKTKLIGFQSIYNCHNKNYPKSNLQALESENFGFDKLLIVMMK
ncbi:unnamed protein product [Paramecium sonneborni]|uniref:Uncharacterized protein n=1 Tax=Paramecium sonneborni TaxID=65129 RepID=A0A8S1R3H0_9CILI|nr:unnamed protein product [Paramecium sonneborni]